MEGAVERELSNLKGVLQENRNQLLTRANVVATGIGYKASGGNTTPTLSIICSVVQKLPPSRLSPREMIPSTIGGLPTDVVQTGRIRAFQPHTTRYRPAPGGISIGHKDITAGTLGCLVKKGGEFFILSNNHVLANSNAAQVGDAILQPGPYDGGRFPDDHLANLEAFVPISFTGGSSKCSTARGVADFLNSLARALGSDARLQAVTTQAEDNLVDAAIARPLNPAEVKDEILEIGPLSGVGSGVLGMAIKKSGRTTGLTTGEIQQVDVTSTVQYGENKTARFTDQLLAGAMSQGGDSGSAILDTQNRLIGLLFAGSENSTIINRIEHVFSALGVSR
jgi:hypothetical protein